MTSVIPLMDGSIVNDCHHNLKYGSFQGGAGRVDQVAPPATS